MPNKVDRITSPPIRDRRLIDVSTLVDQITRNVSKKKPFA